jgi:hypothetical protein
MKQHSLLKKYHEAVQGLIFTEVPVGEWSGDRNARSSYRFIDGVRVILPRPIKELKKIGGNQKDFEKQAKGAVVEAIEVDEYLCRGVIGQAIVAKVMLEIDYGVHAAIPVVVCRYRDKSLGQACMRLGVTVWTPADGFLVRVVSSLNGTQSSQGGPTD